MQVDTYRIASFVTPLGHVHRSRVSRAFAKSRRTEEISVST